MDYESATKSRKHSIIIEVNEVSPLTTSRETSLSGHTGFVKNPIISSEVAEIFVHGNICQQSLRAVSIQEAGSLITSECILESQMSLQPTLCRTGRAAVGEKRRTEMWLPSFSTLGIDSLTLPEKQQHHNKQQKDGKDLLMTALQADLWQHSSDLCSEKFGIVPLPTPPDDAPFTWESEHRSGVAIESLAASSQQAAPTSHRVSQSTAESTSNRPPSIPLPPYGDMDESGGLPSTWLDRAIGKLFAVSSRDDIVRERHLTMVVQASPSQAKFPLAKPVFQQVVEALQQQSANAPYILITHAVSQVVSMEEIPASPPATPNTLNTSDDYFDDQTIFTHAAVIPSYHTPSSVAPPAKLRANGINAPASTHVSTLERYIPPTTKQEVEDFFSIRRSHLVDRLTELSPNNGTLLLIYPTASGARTFAHNYIGPIIEPFLRQFCLLNNLTSDAATRLGKVAALSAMKDFEAMTHALQDLCSSLTERAPADREPRSGYHVIHAEAASMAIQRRTWIEWFIEQEAMRLKQDMIDYQKAGGRMPARDFGNTPGSLAREVIDGIRNSKETTGGEIEVGVYVIRRSLI